jgi:hypothetical protein
MGFFATLWHGLLGRYVLVLWRAVHCAAFHFPTAAPSRKSNSTSYTT